MRIRSGEPEHYRGAGLELAEWDAKCKHCGHSGHMVSLCFRKAAEKRGESEQLLARDRETFAFVPRWGIKDGIHRARHHGFAAADQYASGGDGGDKN